jgi:hypothetical protein
MTAKQSPLLLENDRYNTTTYASVYIMNHNYNRDKYDYDSYIKLFLSSTTLTNRYQTNNEK